MAVTGLPPRVSLTVSDVAAAMAFYADALGFVADSVTVADGSAYGVANSTSIVAQLSLGCQGIDLVSFDPPGCPYPEPRTSHDPWFQHLAIVVSDMAAALRALDAVTGWRPISIGGAQVLPAASGGVTAFKFRDPDGNPLELLGFPPGAVPMRWRDLDGAQATVGIDHTAIVIADTARSIAFYSQWGFAVSSQTLNAGPEQERLDAAPQVQVQVTGMSLPSAPTPHLELLCYRAPPSAPNRRLHGNDIGCTRLILRGDRAATIHDPDGHAVQIIAG